MWMLCCIHIDDCIIWFLCRQLYCYPPTRPDSVYTRLFCSIIFFTYLFTFLLNYLCCCLDISKTLHMLYLSKKQCKRFFNRGLHKASLKMCAIASTAPAFVDARLVWTWNVTGWTECGGRVLMCRGMTKSIELYPTRHSTMTTSTQRRPERTRRQNNDTSKYLPCNLLLWILSSALIFLRQN